MKNLLGMTMIVSLLFGCTAEEPWYVEEACREAARSYCERKLGCDDDVDYDLCERRVLSDCKIGLEGRPEAEDVEACLGAVEDGSCWDLEHIPAECTDWWCTGDEAPAYGRQDYCPAVQ